MYLGKPPPKPFPPPAFHIIIPTSLVSRREFDRWVCGSRHLSHIVFEVLKNALRAVVEKHGPASDDFPPIKMLVAEGEEAHTLQWNITYRRT